MSVKEEGLRGDTSCCNRRNCCIDDIIDKNVWLYKICSNGVEVQFYSFL